MSGKKQRTKGKPSSSARAAELLAAEGYDIKNTIGFVGFGALGTTSSDSAGVVDDRDDLDEEFRCSFRKAMKKDSVTKIKALREITSMIGEKDDKIVSVAWQCWPRLYSKLALDGDFKVRELTHVTLGTFARKLGRQIAGNLKNVLPYWIMGEHDPYQVAAQAAKQSFQESFPQGKRPQVLAYCKDAIITQCCALIFAVDEVTSVGAPGDTEESSENRAVRLSSCALGALHTLVSSLSEDELKNAEDSFQRAAFSLPKFWKLGEKAKPTAVRIAWFNLISCLLRRCSALLSGKAEKLVAVVVNVIDEKDGAVVAAGWNCIESYMDTNPDEFRQHSNFRKTFMPKLLAVTKKAYNGNCIAIGRAITKVLERLPTSEDAAEVYGRFVTSFNTGCQFILGSKISPAETTAFILLYSKFIKFMLASNSCISDFKGKFLTDPDQSLFVISSCLKSSSPSLTTQSFQSLADMIAYITDQLASDEPTLADNVLTFQSNLIRTLTDELRKKTSPTYMSHMLVQLQGRSTALKDSCATAVHQCWTMYQETGDVDYLRIFRNVICTVGDVQDLVARFEPDGGAENAVDKFMATVLARVVAMDKDETSGGHAAGALLDCCFSLLPALNSNQKTKMLKELCQLRQFEMQYEFLKNLRNCKMESVSEFVPQVEFCQFFVDSFKSMCSFSVAGGDDGDTQRRWRLFTDYLVGTTEEKGSHIPTEVVSTALEHLTSLIEADISGKNLQVVLTLVSKLTSDILVSKPDLLYTRAGLNLVCQLFEISCAHSDDLEEETLDTIKHAWTTAVKTFKVNVQRGDENADDLVSTLANHLLLHVRQADMNRAKLEWLCSIAVDVALTGKSSREEENAETMPYILSHFLPHDDSMAIDTADTANDWWRINAVVSGQLPLTDLAFSDASPAHLGNKVVEFLNLAAYGLRFGCILSGYDSSFPELEYFAHIATSGFAAVSFIHHATQVLSIVDNAGSTVSSLKSFGAWMSTLVRELWSPRQPDQRAAIARSVMNKSLQSGALFAQAMRFLQYEMVNDTIPIGSSDYARPQFVIALCTANSIANNSLSGVFPDSSSTPALSGFLNITAVCGESAKISAFDWLMSIKAGCVDEKMLFSCDMTNANEEAIILNIALMRYFAEIIPIFRELSSEQRDFVLCATLTWLQACEESDLINSRVQLFSIFAIQLFCKIATFMNSVSNDGNVESLADEWTGFFLKGCSLIISSLYFKLAKEQSSNFKPLQQYVLRDVSAAVCFARKEDLMELELLVRLAPQLDTLMYPEKLQTILLSTFPLLESACVSTQVAACTILERFVGEVYEYESKNVRESEAGETRELPFYFVNTINKQYDRIEDELDNLHHLENVPAWVGYFLVWKLLLQFFTSVKTDDRPAYSSLLTSSKLLDKLMLALFAVLPERISASGKYQLALDDGGRADVELDRKLIQCLNSFEEAELKSVLDVADVNSAFLDTPGYSPNASSTIFVQQYASHILFEILRAFPAAVRHWFNSQEKKMANLIERFIGKYVSPILCNLELQAITKGEKKYENMTLLARPAAREVVASYKLEDFTMELVVNLPHNYPLSAASVDVSNRVGVSVEQWRKWMLQLTVFLSHQNGGLLEGMLLWKRCIDKHLQGVEDCMICMMAVHGSNYQLPKITCKKCKKKFHAACLYKWFNTSSNTSCPLCRSSF